ncbi:MAG: peptidoglycan-binding domain-containing protein [Caldicoprobacterales bacterium]|nr:peptidoglycan-binding protein [Clostridiales bacterium]
MGSVGPEVEMLQRILYSIGYDPGPIDGIFGPLTRSAVVKFQIDNGLVPDGIVGPRTWAAIDLVYP